MGSGVFKVRGLQDQGSLRSGVYRVRGLGVRLCGVSGRRVRGLQGKALWGQGSAG